MKSKQKKIEINIYNKFQSHKEHSENIQPKAGPCCQGSQENCKCSPHKDSYSTLQELTQSIQAMQNRLKYIESAKIKHERQIDSTIKKTNNFISTRLFAEELSKQVNDIRAREESQKVTLRTKAAELQSQHKKALMEKTLKIKSEKLRQSELVKQEKIELERRAKQIIEEDLMTKKSKVLKIKGEKGTSGDVSTSVTPNGPTDGGSMLRRGSMMNLDVTFNRTENEARRRQTMTQEKAGWNCYFGRSKSKVTMAGNWG